MSIGAGLDISELTESEFNIKEYEDLSEILAQYNNNNDIFNLYCTVTGANINYEQTFLSIDQL